MSLNSTKVGEIGERIAIRYLQNKGYNILDKNYFIKEKFGPKIGEIDIVAKHKRSIIDVIKNRKNSICFVEVKAFLDSGRQEVYGFLPEDKVDFRKQRKLVMAAQSWLSDNKIPLDVKWQIDVISVILNLRKKKAKIKHFQNI